MKRAVAFGMAMITALTLLAGCGAQGNSDAAKSNADGTESSTAAESAEEDSSADARGTEESVPAGEKVTTVPYAAKKIYLSAYCFFNVWNCFMSLIYILLVHQSILFMYFT